MLNIRSLRVSAFIVATTGALSVLTACGDDGGSNATPVPTATIVVTPESSPVAVPTRDELKAEVAAVYGSVEIPFGGCDGTVITSLVDLNYGQLESSGDNEAFAEGMLLIAAEVRGLLEATSAPGSSELYDRVAAAAEEAYRRDAGNRGEEYVDAKMEGWHANTFLGSSLTEDGGCTLATG